MPSFLILYNIERPTKSLFKFFFCLTNTQSPYCWRNNKLHSPTQPVFRQDARKLKIGNLKRDHENNIYNTYTSSFFSNGVYLPRRESTNFTTNWNGLVAAEYSASFVSTWANRSDLLNYVTGRKSFSKSDPNF